MWNKEELPEQWKESTIVSIYKKGTKDVVIIEASLFWAIYKIQPNTLLSELTPHVDEIVFQFGTPK